MKPLLVQHWTRDIRDASFATTFFFWMKIPEKNNDHSMSHTRGDHNDHKTCFCLLWWLREVRMHRRAHFFPRTLCCFYHYGCCALHQTSTFCQWHCTQIIILLPRFDNPCVLAWFSKLWIASELAKQKMNFCCIHNFIDSLALLNECVTSFKKKGWLVCQNKKH